MSKGARNRQRRRDLPPSNPVSQSVRRQDGATILGGCDRCDAYQVVGADHYGANLHRIAIHHDEWCPVLAQHTTAKGTKCEGTP